MLNRRQKVRRKTAETAAGWCQGGRNPSERLGSAAAEQWTDLAHTAVTNQVPILTLIVTSEHSFSKRRKLEQESKCLYQVTSYWLGASGYCMSKSIVHPFAFWQSLHSLLIQKDLFASRILNAYPCTYICVKIILWC